MGSKIEWTDETWNFLAGCSPVSEGCRHCYAAREAVRLAGNPNAKITAKYAGTAEMRGLGSARRAVFTGRVNIAEEVLSKPLKAKKPRRWFVNSMSDLFHPAVSFDVVDRAFAVMALSPLHTFQILTKRPERMAEYLADPRRSLHVGLAAFGVVLDALPQRKYGEGVYLTGEGEDTGRLKVWPLPNVWLGTSVEDQAAADERIPHLLRCPAAVRFLSCEPLLGAVDLTRVASWAVPGRTVDVLRFGTWDLPGGFVNHGDMHDTYPPGPLSWVIVGGESGHGARMMQANWAQSLRDQCQAAGVAFFFKQWGEYLPDAQNPAVSPLGTIPPDYFGGIRMGKRAAGRLLDGVEHSAFPEAPVHG